MDYSICIVPSIYKKFKKGRGMRHNILISSKGLLNKNKLNTLLEDLVANTDSGWPRQKMEFKCNSLLMRNGFFYFGDNVGWEEANYSYMPMFFLDKKIKLPDYIMEYVGKMPKEFDPFYTVPKKFFIVNKDLVSHIYNLPSYKAKD